VGVIAEKSVQSLDGVLAWIPMLDVSANTSVSATRRLPLGGAHFC
jgi:hypothetical protein